MKFLKRMLALTFALLLAASCAYAAPRYPQKKDNITDAALLLSASTVDDLKEFNDELKDETGFTLVVATVDFLDGATVSEYGEGLRSAWSLGSRDLLLLMAAGEDQFGFFAGDRVTEKLPTNSLNKLLSTSFQQQFLAQDYDGALNALVPALATELNKACDASIRVDGIFGQAAATAAPTVSAQEWLERQTARPTATPVNETRERIEAEADDNGLSFGKVILTVFLLLIIFGNWGKGKRGCFGCMPFSSLLAGWGLFKVWGSGSSRGRGPRRRW